MNLFNTIEELKCTAKDLRLPDLRRVISNLKPDRDDPTAVGTSEFADAVIGQLAAVHA